MRSSDDEWLVALARSLQAVKRLRQEVTEYRADLLILRADISDAREGGEPDERIGDVIADGDLPEPPAPTEAEA